MQNLNIQGWTTPTELDWLYHHAMKMASIVEVGSWKGRSTFSLLSGCKGIVTAVDHFNGSPSAQFMVDEAKDDAVYNEFLCNVGHFSNLVILRKDSVDASKDFKLKEIDMVFIDADHTYEDVKRDLLAWIPKTRKLICGHDYDHDDVKRAVDEILGDVKVTDSIWHKTLK